ncbi:hypothetical protein ONS95_005116 [Cadophora gregata]|uniref:uncharacterized protein n=1 Tax=Cadophora gregata TaxID=51156 RepID=UPI0026DD0255|nr:uncharacterized protein ONS95_005116 [Cadophora gregata]KAK0104850.1 hypothetical protein ONS95_005116 [Cadophora gregata]KAK0115069.1 hypothetical protein ONS96_013539 [Cadophora gregata f. sp. sojae]
MAPVQTQRPMFYTRDIAAFSDAELDQYLEKIGRARTGGALSRPIDLNDLTARLEGVIPKRSRLAQPPQHSQAGSDFCSRSTTESIDDEEWYHHLLRRETRFYDTLVREGGRPSHPVSLGRDVLENPGEYREILSFWNHGLKDWEVFHPQMSEW